MKQGMHQKPTKNALGFTLVVNAFADDRQVSPPGTGKGFGSGALKVNGKIFAMISSKGEFVVKLSEERVNELVAASKGSRFDPGRGRVMKEWLVVTADPALWIPLAKEARKLLGKVTNSAGLQNLAPRPRGARKLATRK
jgi:hypothetical protein